MNEQLLEQILQETQRSNRLKKRNTWALRICALVLAAVVAALCWFTMEVRSIGASVQQITDTVTQLDIDSINGTLANSSEATAHLKKVTEDLETFSDKLNQLFGGK